MRGLVRLILGCVVLAVLFAGAIALIPASRVAGLAAAEVERLTGRTLAIAGPVRASVWPVLGLTMGGVTLANARWSEEGPMLSADRLAMALDLRALAGGAVRITTIRAEGLRLVLERGTEGRANWDFAADQGGAAPATGGTTATPFAIDRLSVDGATVVWIDHAAGRRQTFEGIAATLSAPDPQGPATLRSEAAVGGQTVRLDATAGPFGAVIAGQVGTLTARLRAGKSDAAFDGRAGFAPAAAEGRLTADLADLRALAALTGGSPDLPEGLGARLRRIEGRLTLAPEGSLHLREGLVTLDGNRLQVAADVTFGGPRPRMSAQIDTGTLQVPGLALPAPAAAGSPRDAGWPRDAIDVSALALADLDIAFRADAVTLGPASLGRTRLKVTLDRARAVIEAHELRAWGGNVGGQFVVNGRGGLSVGGDLTLTGLAMQPLLETLAGYDRLVGSGDARLGFLGAGASVAAIMASLSGEGSLSLGRGELRGLDLLGMLRTLDPAFAGEGQRTLFDAVSASFTIEGGVLRNDDLALASPYLAASGKGSLGLGAQVIDYRITPTALTRADGSGGVRVPLQITGPWSAPRFGLDLKALADQELADERARLEAAAAEAAADLQEKAAAEAGLDPQPGEDIADAAARRAREILTEGTTEALQGVLEGN